VIVLFLVWLACTSEPAAPPVAVVDRPPKEAPESAAPSAPLPCPSPWLPLVEGAHWDHTVRTGRTRTRVRTTIGRIQKTAARWRADVEVRGGARVLRGAAECTADGTFMDLAVLHAVGDARSPRAAADLRSAGHEGMLVPAGDGFAPDAAWTASLATLVSAGDSMLERATIRSELRLRRLADEHVETPAGSFEAAHVVAEAAGEEDAVLMGRSEPPRTLAPWRVEIWLARDVGEVRSLVEVGDARTEWTLDAWEIPAR
jgi:hypothetical protein